MHRRVKAQTAMLKCFLLFYAYALGLLKTPKRGIRTLGRDGGFFLPNVRG